MKFLTKTKVNNKGKYSSKNKTRKNKYIYNGTGGGVGTDINAPIIISNEDDLFPVYRQIEENSISSSSSMSTELTIYLRIIGINYSITSNISPGNSEIIYNMYLLEIPPEPNKQILTNEPLIKLFLKIAEEFRRILKNSLIRDTFVGEPESTILDFFPPDLFEVKKMRGNVFQITLNGVVKLRMDSDQILTTLPDNLRIPINKPDEIIIDKLMIEYDYTKEDIQQMFLNFSDYWGTINKNSAIINIFDLFYNGFRIGFLYLFGIQEILNLFNLAEFGFYINLEQDIQILLQQIISDIKKMNINTFLVFNHNTSFIADENPYIKEMNLKTVAEVLNIIAQQIVSKKMIYTNNATDEVTDDDNFRKFAEEIFLIIGYRIYSQIQNKLYFKVAFNTLFQKSADLIYRQNVPPVENVCLFVNGHNICYMISVIQLLWKIDTIRDYLLKLKIFGDMSQLNKYTTLDDDFLNKIGENGLTYRESGYSKCAQPDEDKNLLIAFSELFNRIMMTSSKQKYSKITLTDFIISKATPPQQFIDIIIQMFLVYNNEFRFGHHEDASEFLSILSNELFLCFQETMPIYNSFSFLIEKTFYCDTDHDFDGTKIEQSNLLTLEIPQQSSMLKTLQISDCIQNYTKLENFTEGERPHCDKKHDHYRKSIRINIKLNKNTEYILITLKRFIYNIKTGMSKKNEQSVIPNKILIIDGVKFIINGCIYHSGQLTSGHYVFINYDDKGKPIEVYDDSAHYPYNSSHYNQNKGYIYLYKKVVIPIKKTVISKPVKIPPRVTNIKKEESEVEEGEEGEEENEEEEESEEDGEGDGEGEEQEQKQEEEKKTAIELLNKLDGNKAIECLAYYLADNFIEDYIKTNIFPKIDQQDPFIAVNKQANSYRINKLEIITKLTSKLEEYMTNLRLKSTKTNPFSYLKTIFSEINEKKNENSKI